MALPAILAKLMETAASKVGSSVTAKVEAMETLSKGGELTVSDIQKLATETDDSSAHQAQAGHTGGKTPPNKPRKVIPLDDEIVIIGNPPDAPEAPETPEERGHLSQNPADRPSADELDAAPDTLAVEPGPRQAPEESGDGDNDPLFPDIPDDADKGPSIFLDSLSSAEWNALNAMGVRAMLDRAREADKQLVIGLGGKVMTQREYDLFLEREMFKLQMETGAAIAGSPLGAVSYGAASLVTDDPVVLNNVASFGAEIEGTVSGKSGKGRKRQARRGKGKRPIRKRSIVDGVERARESRKARLLGSPRRPNRRYDNRRLGKPSNYTRTGITQYIRPLRPGARGRYRLSKKAVVTLQNTALAFKKTTKEIEHLSNPDANYPLKKADTSSAAHEVTQHMIADLKSIGARVRPEPRLSRSPRNKTRSDISVEFPGERMIIELKRTAFVKDGKPFAGKHPHKTKQIQSLENRARRFGEKVFIVNSSGNIYGFHVPSGKWEPIN